MRKEPAVVIANALIWGFVVIACARALGADEYQKIQLTLGGGAAASLLVVGVGVLRRS